ncbi:MAG TPA: DUF4082 domain-containing protein, partial [Cellulomonas sp.]|nr:DUF4082 domain-containing protein [Cellulomonas sp.]
VEVSTDNGATWHPATGTTSWTYTYIQAGLGSVPIKVRAIDDSANIGATPTTRNVTVACPCSVFGSTVPATQAANDSGSVELGLRFTSSSDGYATGVRFFKGTGNSGTHTGRLWSTTGQLLASVTFTGESATGWQTAQFGTPVALTAGTSYVVSYTAPAGHYAVAANYFDYKGVTAAPLSTPGGFGAPAAGVYGDPGTFPSSSYAGSNYYVDVQFGTVDSTPLTIGGQVPLPGSSSISTGTAVKVVLSKPVSGTPTLSLAKSTGGSVAGTSAYAAATKTITFTPSAALANATSYVATVAAVDTTGAGISGSKTWSFTTAAAPQVAGARTVSLYDDDAVPGLLEDVDAVPVTLGVRFASSVDGTVTGVRFYKGPNNTGTHTGALWAVGGTTPLAQATFTSESTTGWQTLTFATPIHISKDTEYVASYRTTVGKYSATVGAFSGTGVQRAPLRTTSNSGSYSYADAYPGSTSSTSYMVDVVFTQDAAALTVVSQAPAPSDPGASVSAPVSITFNAPLAAGATLGLKAGTTTVAGTSSKSSDGRTLTFTPNAALSASTVYTATASGLTSTDGASLGTQTWSFTTATATGCPCTLFGSVIPATPAANDSASVELGVAFTPTATGVVTGVRFYKGSGNGGTHTGTLWSSTGQQLRTVTFTGESSTGWQTATFSSPYEVTPGTTYVVSYLAPQGHYAAAANAFTANQTVGPLSVPAAGNGRYRYGGGFPTDTWQQTNYFVDVVFSTAPASAPTVAVQAPPGGATGVSPSATVAATLSKAPASGTPVMALTGP